MLRFCKIFNQHTSLRKHEHLVRLCTQHRQLVLPPQYEDSPTRFKTCLYQTDVHGVAL